MDMVSNLRIAENALQKIKDVIPNGWMGQVKMHNSKYPKYNKRINDFIKLMIFFINLKYFYLYIYIYIY